MKIFLLILFLAIYSFFIGYYWGYKAGVNKAMEIFLYKGDEETLIEEPLDLGPKKPLV